MQLHWQRGGRFEETPNGPRAAEWLGQDEDGNAIALVVHVSGPIATGGQVRRAIALDPEAKLVRILPPVPPGASWLAVVGGRVVGRASVPLEAVRWAERALSS